MKKLLAIVLSLVMLLAVGMTSVSAFAANGDTVGSIEDTTKDNKITVQVNGKSTTEVTYEKDPKNPKKITFTYTGDGKLIGWEFPGMTEGVDYEIIREKGNSITILVSPDYDGEVIANAIVDTDSETTRKPGEDVSPDTGVAAATGIAAMGAGVAILAALKKKEDEE